MENIRQFMTRQWLHNDMDMIGHDTPGKQMVSLAVKVLQGIGHCFCNFIPLQPAGTVARIQETLDRF